MFNTKTITDDAFRPYEVRFTVDSEELHEALKKITGMNISIPQLVAQMNGNARVADAFLSEIHEAVMKGAD